MKIFLLRHGESTSDIEDRYGGDYDDHLTDRGVAESQELAIKLADKGIEAIFCSPRLRAKETGEIVRQRLGCELQIVDELRERNSYGILTGMVKAEAAQKYPDLAQAVKSYGNTIEGAEKYEAFTERVKRAFDEVASTRHKTVAILTHGGPIRCFFREVMKTGELKTLGDCAIFELDYNDLRYQLLSLDGAEFDK